MVSPTANTSGVSFSTEDTPTKSSTVGSPMKTVFCVASTASKSRSLGETSDGAVVSTTVTDWVTSEMFP